MRSRAREVREKKQTQRLLRAFEAARARISAGQLAADQLPALLAASDSEQRLLGLVAMRVLIEQGQPPSAYLDLAEPLIADADSTCRWQACIVVSEAISSSPDSVWEAILAHSNGPDGDLQAALACVLLEELLQHDFDAYFPRLKREVWAGRSSLQGILRMCWLDLSGRQRSQLDRFLERGR